MLLLRRKAPREIRPELLDQQRDAFGAATLVTERVLNDYLVERRSVGERDCQPICDRALVRVVIILRELRIFHAFHLVAQRIDARVARDGVFVIGSRQAPENQRHGDHVLDTVIAVGRIVQRAFFIDDADGRFVRADRDLRDVFDTPAARAQLLMQRHRRFSSRLRMEFRGERNLEEHVLHHVRAVRTLEPERLSFEQHVVEAPRFRGQHGRIAHFARLRDQRETHRARRGVACCPGLARARVRRVAVSAQRVSIDKRLRHCVDQLIARQSEQLANHGCGSKLHEQHMIEADLVERVFERDAALNFVRLDHGDQDVFHRERLFAVGDGGAREPVGRRENAAEVIGRMAPFGREPGVVEVEPADHGADVERGLHRVQLERRARHPGAVRDDRAGHDRSHQLGAGRVGQGFESAAERVDQAIARRLQRKIALELVIQHIVDDIDQYCIRIGPDVGDRCGHRGFPVRPVLLGLVDGVRLRRRRRALGHGGRHAFVGQTRAVLVREQHRLGRDHDEVHAACGVVEAICARRRVFTRQVVVLVAPVDSDDLVALHVALQFERQTFLARPLFRTLRNRIDLGFLGRIRLALDQALGLRRLRLGRGGRLCERAGRRHQQCRRQSANNGSDQQFFHGREPFYLISEFKQCTIAISQPPGYCTRPESAQRTLFSPI
ncbi:hypothetical protein BCAR13_120040 [Paraburkholderia caribensis]|nr:hypothetical protein BCAR13_120040 [Paraburkholderia caribensis]